MTVCSGFGRSECAAIVFVVCMCVGGCGSACVGGCVGQFGLGLGGVSMQQVALCCVCVFVGVCVR